MADDMVPTGIGSPILVLVAVSITVTKPLEVRGSNPRTYARWPSALTMIGPGFVATLMVELTVCVVVSMTLTVPLAEVVTYRRLPSGLTATPKGEPGTAIVPSIASCAGLSGTEIVTKLVTPLTSPTVTANSSMTGDAPAPATRRPPTVGT